MLSIALGLVSWACPPVTPARPPNIVFILIDDMGWPDLGCYGHPFHETPQIDALASHGVRFTDFYAASPVCSSTRASIQSGQSPARIGITDFIPGHWRRFAPLVVPRIAAGLPRDIQTPGELLAAAGYATAYFGKWHLGGDDAGPAVHGYATTARDADDPDGSTPPGPKRIDLLTEQTVRFIAQNRQRPFFVTLSHHAVHIPIEASAELLEKYRDKPRPATGVNNPAYAAMVEEVDRSVGRIMRNLVALGLSEDTVVLLTSDNGGLRRIYTGVGEDVSSNVPLRGEKGTLYEGGIRVPLIVRWPGVIPEGSVSAEPATTNDLLPTFVELAQARSPTQPTDGESLLPILRHPARRLGRDAIHFHYPHYHHGHPAGAIRQGRWKLIENFETGAVELYDLGHDLAEQVDLSVREPERAAALRAHLVAWREKVGARMPTPNPEHDPARAHKWWSRRDDKPIDAEAIARRYRSRTKER